MNDAAARVRVLIAEDEPDVRRTLVELLALEPGIDVVAACADGEKALEDARALRPHVVLTDLAMPGLDGIELTRALQTLPNPPGVLLLSGRLGADDTARAWAAGVAAIMLKPPHMRTLLEKLLALADASENR